MPAVARRATYAAAVAALTAALVAGAASARQGTTFELQLDDYVILPGTQIACVPFAAARGSRRPGGIICYRWSTKKKSAKTIASKTLVIYLKRNGYSGIIPSGHAALRPFLASTNASTLNPAALGDTFRVAGTNVTCDYLKSKNVAPGANTIICYRGDSVGPLPRSGGVAITDTLALTLSWDEDRHVRVNVRRRH